MILRAVAFVAALALSVAAPLPAEAQATAKVWRIGYLSLVAGDREEYKPWLAGFRDALRQLGYVEGDNLVIEQRYAAGQVERLPSLAAELIRLQVDLLLTAPAGTAAAAKSVTQTVPIVFVGEPDPVGTGLFASLARPGGNATGLADAHGHLLSKRLELQHEDCEGAGARDPVSALAARGSSRPVAIRPRRAPAQVLEAFSARVFCTARWSCGGLTGLNSTLWTPRARQRS